MINFKYKEANLFHAFLFCSLKHDTFVFTTMQEIFVETVGLLFLMNVDFSHDGVHSCQLKNYGFYWTRGKA